MPVVSHYQTSHVGPHFNHIDLRNPVVPLMMPVPMVVSHDQKSHVAPDFDHLDLKNAILTLMMLYVSHDTDSNVSGTTSPKELCCTSFQLS